MKRVYLTIAVAVAMMGPGCKKKGLEDTTHKTVAVAGKQVPQNLMPEVKNGMLSFRDNEHFDGYLDYLTDSIITQDSTDPGDTLETDLKLDQFEAQMGYSSLRKKLNDYWGPIYEQGFENPEQAPDDFFIHNPAMRSVYNADRCVMIGGAINHIHSKNVGVLIKDGSTETLAKVLAVNDEAPLETVTSAFNFDDNVTVYDNTIEPVVASGSGHWKVTADSSWKANFTIEYDPNTLCIYNHKKFYLRAVGLSAQTGGFVIADWDLFHNDATGIQSHMDIFVDWGDGTNNTYSGLAVVHTDPFSGGPVVTWPNTPTHTYVSGGTKNVTVWVKRPYHSAWVASTTKSFDIPEYKCGLWGEKETDWTWKYSSDGERAVAGKIITYGSWFNGHPRFEATTNAWVKSGSVFKNKKVDRVVVQMWGTFYNLCGGTPVYKEKADWPWGQKSASVIIKGLGSVDYGSYEVIYSNHRIKYGEDYINLDLKMPRCE